MPRPPGDPAAIVIAWSGAAVDSTRSRLVIWGGGHGDYYGNELYAIDLPSLSAMRLTDPSPVAGTAVCSSALSDGQPASRHTYDGMAYSSHQDRLWSVGGSLAGCGFSEPALWSYDFGSSRWTMPVARVPVPTLIGLMVAYDAQERRLLIKDAADFYAYGTETGTFTKLNPARWVVDYRMSGAFDSKRRRFVMIGDGVCVIDLATMTFNRVTTTNAPALVSNRQAPGFEYDPVSDRCVAWHGGSQVWALDMDSMVWTQVALNIGPTSNAPVQGTFGRWGYIPRYGVFVLVNSIDENAWVFRLYP